MIQELTQWQDQKKSQKKKLSNLRDEYLKTIYIGCINKKSSNEIGKELYDLTINKKEQIFCPSMFERARWINDKISKKKPQHIIEYVKKNYPAYANDLKDSDLEGFIALWVFSLFNKIKAREKITLTINDELREEETKEKEKIIDNFINKSRKHLQVLYLASSHKDSASDHINYQGKMYYDENYKNIVKDKNDVEQIERYIKKNNLMSMQEVMGKPVWFVTRPNCRHYFKAIDTDIVFKYDVSELTRRYKMHRAVGDREYLQTLKSSKDRKILGEERNAELMIDRYKDRLQTHRTLYESFKSSLVKSAIQKDIQLIGKWKEYLSKLKNEH